jgi:hypothetical protein
MRVLSACALSVVAVVAIAATFALAVDEHGNVGSARGVQSEVDQLQHEMVAKMHELEDSFLRRRVPVLQKRNKLLLSVPGFWKRALTNHPNWGQVSFNNDADMLDALTSVDVEDHPTRVDAASGHEVENSPTSHAGKYTVRMRFAPNRFFTEAELWRVVDPYNHDQSGAEMSGVTWQAQQQPESATFFHFFEKPSAARGAVLDLHRVLDIAHLLRYEMYVNPFTYYDVKTHEELMAEEASRRDEMEEDARRAEAEMAQYQETSEDAPREDMPPPPDAGGADDGAAPPAADGNL